MPKMPDNCEVSIFKAGEYNAYDGKGYRWRVRKLNEKMWVASPAPNNPTPITESIKGKSLTAVAQSLATRRLVPSTVNLFFS